VADADEFLKIWMTFLTRVSRCEEFLSAEKITESINSELNPFIESFFFFFGKVKVRDELLYILFLKSTGKAEVQDELLYTLFLNSNRERRCPR